MAIATEILKHAVLPGYTMGKIVEASAKAFSEVPDSTNLQDLKEQAARESLKASVLQNQAKVEQELAIARRIDRAEEVEIEEYYDVSGKGGLGVSGAESGVTIGLNGEGRKVTKRIIKFKGCAPAELTDIETN